MGCSSKISKRLKLKQVYTAASAFGSDAFLWQGFPFPNLLCSFGDEV